ncbi:pupal cuticle protein 36a-like [Penaeus chinensis]|uniref:pupal cuticle protein 36a-like n=1 Tax=Penaeus chinensis TaxID=139456 RepID=UPI001FB80010|nr:pupal cuticle protein 36a-like [Penaeus chinensis]
MTRSFLERCDCGSAVKGSRDGRKQLNAWYISCYCRGGIPAGGFTVHILRDSQRRRTWRFEWLWLREQRQRKHQGRNKRAFWRSWRNPSRFRNSFRKFFSGIRGSTGGGFGGSAGRFGGSGAGAGGYSGPVIPILRDDRQGPDEFGNYYFNFETGNGISRQEQGAPQGPTGAVASQGAWSFVFPDGTPANFEFIADGSGYRVQSDLLPTPPPLPPHAIAQIEKARLEDAAAAASGGGGGYSGQAGASQSGFGSGQFIGAGQSQFAGPSGSGQRFSGSTLSQSPSTSYGYP